MFRGPNASGTRSDATPPVVIGPESSVAWKAEVPWSPSSPVVAGDRVFLTTFADGKLETRCYAGKDGALVWTRVSSHTELEGFHGTEGSPAAGSPATDGKTVVSYFGSTGLVAYDTEGKELWKHPLPVGSSATPMTYVSPKTGKQYVVISVGGAPYSPDKGDYVMAFALKGGK